MTEELRTSPFDKLKAARASRGPKFEVRTLKLFALLFLLSLPAVTTRLYASDEIQYFAWLRSWAFDRDVNFENEYRYFHDTGIARNPSFEETFLKRRNEADRHINFAPVGCAILWAPFYAGGHLVALATGAPANGLSQPYVAAVSYASAFYGFLAVLLSAAIARRVVGQGALAALVVWIGTPLVYYMYVTPPFSHATSAFAVSLFLYVWLRVRDTWRVGGVALLGVTGALMAMVREQDIFFLVGPALDFARVSLGRINRKHVVVTVAVAAVAFIVAYTPQLLAYKALNGHFGPTNLVARKMYWSSPHAPGVLFSPEHGLFAWTPLALVAIVGLVLLAAGRTAATHREARWIGGLALVMLAAQVYVTGAVDSWTLAGAFGQRRFVALTPVLTLGLAALIGAVALERQRLGRAVVAIAVVLSVWWNVGLMAQFGLHRMDRQRLTLGANAWNTFVVLPLEAPSILMRYFTDRASFYNQPRQ